MKAGFAGNSKLKLVSLLSGLLLVLILSSATVSAASNCANVITGTTDSACPYFQALSGDVFAGGWFNQVNTICSDPTLVANYQAPTSYTNPPAGRYNGAIMGYADAAASPRTGAHSDYGAFALGLSEGSSATVSPRTYYGFYSGLPATGPGVAGTRSLSFANNDFFSLGNSYWGGIFEGAALRSHCISDYYATKNNASSPWTGSLNDQGQRTTGPATISGGTINTGTKLTLFVSGDVYINGDISYASSNITNVPQFTLVVKGNIYIGHGVNRLDGWYIAQPDSLSGVGGEVWTCRDGSGGSIDDTWLRTNCINNDLTVNGALTAKQVNLERVIGDLGGAPAETINYSPAMVLSGEFFNQPSGTGGSPAVIQSLISLPPIF